MVIQNHRCKITSKKKWSGQANYGEGKQEKEKHHTFLMFKTNVS